MDQTTQLPWGAEAELGTQNTPHNTTKSSQQNQGFTKYIALQGEEEEKKKKTQKKKRWKEQAGRGFNSC